MANTNIIDISIGTAQELIDFFSTTMSKYTDYNVTITADIDMIDYGVITSVSDKISNSSESNITIDLNNHTIKNIYPIFISWIVNKKYCLIVKNGFIVNTLINTGSIIDAKILYTNTGIYNNTATFKDIFNTVNSLYNSSYKYHFNVVFENIGFSVLGCNFNDCSIYPATICMCSDIDVIYFTPAYLFKSCSFYVRAYNYEPATNNALYMNCSFYYDVECKKTMFYKKTSSKKYFRNNIYCFCTFNGKLKKSPDYTETTDYDSIIGCMYNSYFNVETDIERPLYIACNVDKTTFDYYYLLRWDSYNVSISGYDFDTTTVYNAEKYLPEIVDGKNCCPVLGATALTDAEMHNTEKLLEIGLLAIDAEGETA